VFHQHRQAVRGYTYGCCSGVCTLSPTPRRARRLLRHVYSAETVATHSLTRIRNLVPCATLRGRPGGSCPIRSVNQARRIPRSEGAGAAIRNSPASRLPRACQARVMRTPLSGSSATRRNHVFGHTALEESRIASGSPVPPAYLRVTSVLRTGCRHSRTPLLKQSLGTDSRRSPGSGDEAVRFNRRGGHCAVDPKAARAAIDRSTISP